MIDAKNDLLTHLKWLRRGALAAGAELILAGDSLQALVRRGQQHLALTPVFLVLGKDGIRAGSGLLDEANAFGGWVLGPPAAWEFGVTPATFRGFARAHGLPTLEDAVGATPPFGGYLLVGPPSVGRGILRGPMDSAEALGADPAREESVEPHVEGDWVRVWFWQGEPICAELSRAAAVVGDGKSSVAALLKRRWAQAGLPDGLAEEVLVRRDGLLVKQGAAPSSVPAEGQRIQVDFARMANFDPGDRVAIDLQSTGAPPWKGLLQRAGRRLQEAIPEPARPVAVFMIEAAVDALGRPWLHSVHGAPVVHPLLYPAMLGSLLGPSQQPRASARPSTTPPT